MSTLAIVIGLFFGLLTAVLGYGVSMLTSGLFARPVYRLYSRVLIGICCVMLLAPALRWLTILAPPWGAVALSIAQYSAMGILGFGVWQFNRRYLKRVFLRRATTSYFIFGTLAYATIVTLTFLHVSVSGAGASAAVGHGYISAAHYGPLLVLLAMMVFDTDSHLKNSKSDLRRFSRFTFVGYAVSFVGLAVSTVPLVANALDRLELVAFEHPWLPSLGCAQALLLAILLYGWLVWRYETIPPLFLLLVAIIAEYHVLLTQWAVRAYGPESWGLVSLPLFVGLAYLANFFSRWDERKQRARNETTGEAIEAANILRFATPFRVVEWSLAAALLFVTLWTRFYVGAVSPTWLAVTFALYSGFFLFSSVFNKQPLLVYLSGGLAVLSALCGTHSIGGAASTVALGCLAAAFGCLACIGEYRGLKRAWRTPLADLSLMTAVLVVALVSSRHLIGSEPYHLHAVGLFDVLALLAVIVAFIACATEYRSQLPTFGVLVSAVIIAPTWSAGLGLVAAIAAYVIERWGPTSRRFVVDDRVHLAARVPLPLSDSLPHIWSRPLSAGAIPLALLGFAISVAHIVQGDLAVMTLAGAWTSASVMFLLTRSCREPWLYVLGILATYVAIYATAQGSWFSEWQLERAVTGHVAIASTISLTGWLLATAYAAWCEALLRRVAEDREQSIRANRSFYSGWLFHVTAVIALCALVATGLLLIRLSSPGMILTADVMLAALFALAASVYRSQIGAYLSLIALTLAVFSAVSVLDTAIVSHSAILAGLGLLAAIVSCLPLKSSASVPNSEPHHTHWLPALPVFSAGGVDLWMRPLARYALVCSLFAVFATMQGTSLASPSEVWLRPAPVTYALASLTWLLSTRTLRYQFIYVVGVTLAFASAHSAAQAAKNLGWIEVDALSLHLIVGSAVALAGCLIATFLSWKINVLLRVADNDERSVLLSRREFYAGTLHHCSLFAAAIALAVLTAMPFMDTGHFVLAAPFSVFTASLLVASLFVSGLAYRSRIVTYGVLSAVVVAVTAVVTVSAEPADKLGYQLVACGFTAVLASSISWWMDRRRQSKSLPVEDREGPAMSARWNTCWTTPPLPLVSNDIGLWAEPLAHASVFLAMGMLVPWVKLWGDASVWVTVVPIFMAACTWGIASGIESAGLFSGVVKIPRSSSMPRADASSEGRFERYLLYAMSVLTLGFGVHATAHLMVMEVLPGRMLAPWHLVVAAALALIGWGVATVIALFLRPADAAKPSLTGDAANRSLYSGLLYHLTFASGVVVLAIAVTFGLPDARQVLPLAITSALLISFFALTGATYRSQLGSYLSLASLSLGVAQLTPLLQAGWGEPVARTASVYALLGLGLMTLAVVANRASLRRMDQPARPRLPVAVWASPALALRATSWSSLWHNPLRQAGVIFASVGFAIVAVHLGKSGFWEGWTIPSLITLMAAAVTFLLATRLYESSLFTYLATTLIVIGGFPLLQTSSVSDSRLGVAWSAFAFGFWLVGYGIERRCSKTVSDDADAVLEASAMRVYERPLIRSSAVIAVVAIVQSMVTWVLSPQDASLTPLLMTGAAGSMALMLNARSMNVLHRFSLGRMLVHIASIAITSCFMTVAWTRGDLGAIGPCMSLIAMFFAAVGLGLMERANTMGTMKPDAAESVLTFAGPLSTWGLLLAILAAVLSVSIAVGSGGLLDTGQIFVGFPAWIEGLRRMPVAITFAVVAFTMLLSARAFRNVVWLDLAVAIGSTGLLLAIQDFMSLSTASIMLLTLLVMNVLVGIARSVRSRPKFLERLLAMEHDGAEQSFCRWPLVVATASLVMHTIYLVSIVSGQIQVDFAWPWMLCGLLCAALFFHLMYVRPHAVLLHLLVASTVVGYFGASLTHRWGLTIDVSLASIGLAWAIVAVQFDRPLGNRVLAMLRLPMASDDQIAAGRALNGWAIGLTTVAVAVTLPIYLQVHLAFPSLAVTLFLASLTFVIVGVRWRNLASSTTAAVLMPACLMSVALRYVDPDRVRAFAGLAIAATALVYVAIAYALRRRGTKPEQPDTFVSDTSKSLINLAHLLVSFAVITSIASMVWMNPSPVFAIAMVCVAVSWLWMAWESGKGVLVYTSAFAIFMSILYVSTALLGLTFSRSPVAAFSVIGYSFSLFAINIMAGRAQNPRAAVFSDPSYYMALLAPVALVLVTPLESPGVAAFTCLAAGSFYLVVSQHGHTRWTLYVAAAFFNVAIYLWIPAAREITGLMQLYVIPAAITVLIFAQLHRHDLEHRALNGIRMAAAGAILAVSTFEVFSSRDAALIQFVAVLLLSLGGIAVGVALRIRPFVSIGIAFLIINVVGQLGLQFKHENGVIRAVILIGIGVLVLSAMIFFNIHRERIMRRYRGFLADENWE